MNNIDLTAERKRFENATYKRYLERRAAGKVIDGLAERELTPEELFWKHENGEYGVTAFNGAWWAWQEAVKGLTVDRSAYPAVTYRVEQSHCFCHPETCNCAPYRLISSDGELDIGMSRFAAVALAQRLNAAPAAIDVQSEAYVLAQIKDECSRCSIEDIARKLLVARSRIADLEIQAAEGKHAAIDVRTLKGQR